LLVNDELSRCRVFAILGVRAPDFSNWSSFDLNISRQNLVCVRQNLLYLWLLVSSPSLVGVLFTPPFVCLSVCFVCLSVHRITIVRIKRCVHDYYLLTYLLKTILGEFSGHFGRRCITEELIQF